MKIVLLLLSFFLGFLVVSTGFSQNVVKQDTVKSVVEVNNTGKKIITDTTAQQELSPLDISNSRGLYILTRDGLMQLRIMGSVRFSALYDIVELPTKNNFITYEIPTGSANHKIPNYANSLSWTRIGFEITRKTKQGNVFIRIETDFAGPNNKFRIRHAYGQVGRWLVGQTWSLLANVSDMPLTVNPSGPAGAVTLRTPQIRFSSRKKGNYFWDVGLEYSQIDLNQQVTDTLSYTTVQMLPDFTGRIGISRKWGSVQFAAVVNTISTKDTQSKVSNSFGFGGFLSGKINLNKSQSFSFQVNSGKSIAHFMSTFSGAGLDAVFDPATGKFKSLYSLGAFVSYGSHWSHKISSSLSFGSANIFNKSFEPCNSFRNSISLSADIFWNVIKGARVGLNYTYGQRWNKDSTTGRASRIWALFYYDF